MRSSVLICFMTQNFCRSEILKKELFMLEKLQKNKKIILIYLEKIPFYAQFYENNDLITSFVFILDGISLEQNDYEENLKVVEIFLKKTINGGFEGYKGQQLMNGNYYFNKIFNNTISDSKFGKPNRPLNNVFKNVVAPSSSTFKKQYELLQTKYENLLELYSLSYDFEKNLYKNDIENALNVLVKFEQIENEIEVLLKDEELKIFNSIEDIQLPNTYLLIFMNLLMNFYNFKQFIIKNLIDVELLIYNQVEYKSESVDRNRNLAQLFSRRASIFDRQVTLIKKQVLVYDTELIDNLAKTIQLMELDMKTQGLLNIYSELVDFDRKIEQKKISLNNEITLKQRLCNCFKDERVITLEEKIKKLELNKDEFIFKINKNNGIINKLNILKQVHDFVENSKIEFEWLEVEKDSSDDFVKKIEKIQYGNTFYFLLPEIN